jgi:hypothetical protein
MSFGAVLSFRRAQAHHPPHSPRRHGARQEEAIQSILLYVFLYGWTAGKALRATAASNGISKLNCTSTVLLFNSPRLHHFFLFVHS